MKVLTAYRLYNPNNVLSGSYYRWSTFENAFKDDPNYSRIKVHYGTHPGCINTSRELNKILLEEDFDIAIVLEEGAMKVDFDTAKKLGKKLFLLNIDSETCVADDLYTNFRMSIKRPRSLINQPIPLIEYAQYCNILIADYGYGTILPNFHAIHCPLDSDIYFWDKSIEQTIDVSHNGNMFIGERHKFADIFKKANLDVVYTRNPRQGEIYTEEDYAMFYKKSKISLCFNESIFGPKWKQRKGRIYEAAACGSFLLMTHPEVLKFRSNTWFTEGEHFDTIDESNCVDKIKYYLANDDKRNQMAESLNQEYIKRYSPKVWWERIFDIAKS